MLNGAAQYQDITYLIIINNNNNSNKKSEKKTLNKAKT